MTGEVGVIIPPPEIRVMIDKTANFVANNGAKLEKKVFASLNANPKFSFILPTDNYHQYYKQQLEKAIEANKEYKIDEDDEDEEDEKSLVASASGVNNNIPEPPKQDETLAKKEEERKSLLDKLRSGKPMQTAPEQPPKPLFIVNVPYTQITALDLDIIKLTAQFVARNGDQFRGGLLNREMRNPQFDFMKAGHHANPLFNSLVDSYQRVLYPPRDVVDQLSKTLNNKSLFLEGLLKKAEWEKYVIQTEKQSENEKEEREARATIDWHNFIIVETITFEENEVLPAPASFSQPNQIDANDDMEMDMEEADSHPVERKVIKNYQPSFERKTKSNTFQKCTICGQDIPVDEFDEHVRIELLDPRFASTRKSNAEKVLNSSLAPASSIVKRLEELQHHRTDIFGDDEVDIGKTVEEDKQRLPEKPIWDGHSSSARTVINTANLAGKSLQEQIEAIHEAKGIKPEVGPIIRPIGPSTTQPQQPLMDPTRMGFQMPYMQFPMPGMPGMPPPILQPTEAYPPINHDEPPLKKSKPLEWSDHLIPEAEFLASHPDPVILKIIVPKQENKQGWLLDGQVLNITIPPSDNVGQLKAVIAEKLNGLPANKQNLKVENMPFLKDKDTLAFYNLDESKEIHLGIKERGKRKK